MKLPPQAKKVFDGEIFDVYQWEQEMYDGSKATFEMLKRPNTVEVIATDGEEIFITEQEQPSKPAFLALPGGRQDEDETIMETGKRELLEEAGLTSDDWETLAVHEPYTKMEWEIHTLIAKNCVQVGEQNLDAGEKIAVKKVSFEKFLELVFSEKYTGTNLTLMLARMSEHELEQLKKKILS